MKHAIISIEDKRFYTNDGVDLRGIGRALYQDVLAQKAVQGGSTIAQQFVKNALAAQNERNLFVKLREAAMAYHLTRKWTKEQDPAQLPQHDLLRQRRLRHRVGRAHLLRPPATRAASAIAARPCAAQLEPARGGAARRRGRLAERLRPGRPPGRRAGRGATSCSQRMLEQDLIAREQYEAAIAEPLPTRRDIQPPREDTKYPYFTSWVKQQVVDKLGGGQTGARQAFEGGLTVQTTLDATLPEGGRRRGRRLAGQPGRAARLARGDRQQERRGPRDGRRRRLQRHAVQPRHPGPAPAGLGLQAVRARGGAQERHLPRSRVASRKKVFDVPGQHARSSRSRTTRTPTPA